MDQTKGEQGYRGGYRVGIKANLSKKYLGLNESRAKLSH